MHRNGLRAAHGVDTVVVTVGEVGFRYERIDGGHIVVEGEKRFGNEVVICNIYISIIDLSIY